MSIYSSIDLETFNWVRNEVETTLNLANDDLQKYVATEDKESLFSLSNQLHQVVGSLQMLEMKSLSSLVMETELLVEDHSSNDNDIRKPAFVTVVEGAIESLRTSFKRIDNGQPENPADVVELINKIRSIRGLDGIEISSLFSPVIDFFPEVNAQTALKDNVYKKRAHALRAHYQKFLLLWLQGNEAAVEKISVIFSKLLEMSAFGTAARLWWVAGAYADFLQKNNTENQTVHSRILRQIGDRFREVESQGESALVRDAGDELIKIMLFYIGVGETRTERMDEIVAAFDLHDYFPSTNSDIKDVDFDAIKQRIESLSDGDEIQLTGIRKLVSSYFEAEQNDSEQLDDLIKQFEKLDSLIKDKKIDVIDEIVAESLSAVKNIRAGEVERNEDSGFHIASAFMFVEKTINEPGHVDENWQLSGELKHQALVALNQHEEMSADLDGSQLSGQERQALLDVVGAEVEGNLKEIEENLDKFSKENTNLDLIAGIDGNIRQVRGALQVLGEQKVGLLLKMAEEQFIAIEKGEAAATPALIEALAISIGTMEEYVKGLQAGRTGMDYLLNRSITDLEVAIGKRVSRDDVEDLLDNASDSLFSWLGKQSDFELFTDVKSSLRDLTILAKKTKLTQVEDLVSEQDRLVDVISQEPAFLTDNVTTNLQNNMVSITEQIVTLYGTEETQEEIESDAELAYKKSAIESDDGPRFHDDMDIEELDDEFVEAASIQEFDDGPSVTEIGKQNAVDEKEAPLVDEAIFEVFVEETEEVLEDANQFYADCVKDRNNREAIRDLRRSFHTLKGSARMVGLADAGEVAWFTESLFNYVLDTEKPLTSSILGFSRDALDEFEKQLAERYQNQHLIDVAAWGLKTEQISLDESEETESIEAADEAELAATTEADALELAETTEADELELEASTEEVEVDESGELNDEVIEMSSELLFDIDAEESGLETDNVSIDDLEEIQLLDGNDDDVLMLDASDAVSLNNEDLGGDIETSSFSIINDKSMREIFIQEAKVNLSKISDKLTQDGVMNVVDDDVMSISIHTLLGNAKTLGLADVANAYAKAEDLCLIKKETGAEITVSEREAINALVVATQQCIDEPLDEEPYFVRDTEQWHQVSSDLQVALDKQPNLLKGGGFEDSLIELDSELIVVDETEDQVIDVDSSAEPRIEFEEELSGIDGHSINIEEVVIDSEEPQIEFEEAASGIDGHSINIEEVVVEESDEPQIEFEEKSSDIEERSIEVSEIDLLGDVEPSDDASERVASVLSEIESIDDLVEPSVEVDNLALDGENDDLADLELSLSSFSEDVASSLDGTDGQLTEPQSLLPDDLTDLLEDDQLEPDLEIEIQETEEPEVEEPEAEELEAEELEVEEPEVEENDLPDELRAIFIEEMQDLRNELDIEVAELSDLARMAPTMANVMRNLHTIKGSSLMAEANTLGQLTHQVETYLESTFIRDEEGLRDVRQTLELFVDAADSATKSYQQRYKFNVPKELATKLGVDFSSPADIKPDVIVPEVEEAEDLDLAIIETSEALETIAVEVDKLHGKMKGVKTWKKLQPQLIEQYENVERVIDSTDSLSRVLPLVAATQTYIADLEVRTAPNYKNSKALLEETFDVIVASSNALVAGQDIEPFDHLLSGLGADSAPAIDEPKQQESAQEAAESEKIDAANFVPGSVKADEQQEQDIKRQEKAARDRAAALRIKTETLDSLTNFVGDASMNRSQMREDVLSVKEVIDQLYNNVQSFSTQLRELEIEADSKISARTNELVNQDRGDEFDPLELDRYTKLQQLSRGLLEDLDDLTNIQTSLSSFVYKAENTLQKQDRLNRELQDEIMQVRLVTFGGVGPQLRQVVRRTARELGKDVDVEIIGADVKLDKTILDGVVPAIEHMLRNAVDHGIESEQDRAKTNKSKTGRVIIECRQVAQEIIISVRDDGAGLDLEKIRLKAVENGMLAEDQPINPQDIMAYISQSGFSTAQKLTQISGRGVGMDVVQSTLRRMSGSITYDVENELPGSHFSIRLPISLAVSTAMFIKAGDKQFAIPSRTIERVVNIDVDEVLEGLKGDKPSIEVGGSAYALIDLADYLGYESQLPSMSGKLSVILVSSGVQNIGVVVEEVLDTQEIVVKGLGDHLGSIPIYGGATIRGDGSVVLLLDVVGISFFESFSSVPEKTIDETHTVPTVMVVDDSLTVRKSAERDITALGINTILAKNGIDAQEKLQLEGKPDMILLDIEMPRMDGFELLEWVKSEDEYKDVPVIMISSRATEKYIDKATKLGSSGFLGKPYLLESLVAAFNSYLPLHEPINLDD